VHRAGFLVEGRALADDMVAGVKARRGVHEQCSEPLLALDQRPRPEILALEIQKIEQEEDQRRRAAASMAFVSRYMMADFRAECRTARNGAELPVSRRISPLHDRGERRLRTCRSHRVQRETIGGF
jgi:hypothetical protein